jgi:hypothetical protein
VPDYTAAAARAREALADLNRSLDTASAALDAELQLQRAWLDQAIGDGPARSLEEFALQETLRKTRDEFVAMADHLVRERATIGPRIAQMVKSNAGKLANGARGESPRLILAAIQRDLSTLQVVAESMQQFAALLHAMNGTLPSIDELADPAAHARFADSAALALTAVDQIGNGAVRSALDVATGHTRRES